MLEFSLGIDRMVWRNFGLVLKDFVCGQVLFSPLVVFRLTVAKSNFCVVFPNYDGSVFPVDDFEIFILVSSIINCL